MPNTINYAEIYSNQLRDLYGQESLSDALYHSNTDIQITGGKTIIIPTLSVSGYKDHTRGSLGFSQGAYENDYETKTLDHDRSIEFVVDPMDFDETDSRAEYDAVVRENAELKAKLAKQTRKVKSNVPES